MRTTILLEWPMRTLRSSSKTLRVHAASFEYQKRQSAKRSRESKQHHEQTQRLARWAIAFAAMGLVVGFVFGVIQCRANKSRPTPNNSAASIVSTITPPAQISPSQRTNAPSATPQPASSIESATPEIRKAKPVLSAPPKGS